jgi:hypothetical protein
MAAVRARDGARRGAGGVIDAYLAELRRALGFGLWAKERVLAEVEDHLRSAAANVGEEEAVRRFGPADQIACAFRARMAWLYAAVAVVFALAFPVLSYPLVENTLPPAPWPTEDRAPEHLRWKQDKIAQLFLLAIGAVVVTALSWRRRGRLRFLALASAAGALALMAVLGVVLSIQWADAVPGSPQWHWLLWAAQLTLVAFAAALLVRAQRAGGAFRSGSARTIGGWP